LIEGWTPEQIAGRLRHGIERGLRVFSTETIYAWIFRAGQKAQKLWLDSCEIRMGGSVVLIAMRPTPCRLFGAREDPDAPLTNALWG
jgi:IS30 family transposase